MHNLFWRLTLILSKLLAAADQDPLLGDLEERRLNGTARGLADVFLFVGAQQFRAWAGWRPWIALISLFPPLSMLIGCVFSVGQIISKYPWHDIHALTPAQMVNLSLASSITVAIWSWSVGFGLGWVAGRAYISVLPVLTLAGLLLIDGGAVASGPLRLKVLAVLMTGALIAAPAFAGLRKGLIGVSLSGRHALGLTGASITALLWTDLQQPGFSADVAQLAASVVFLWPVLVPLAWPLWRHK